MSKEIMAEKTRNSKTVTLKDVAAKAGVSISTVSRVLNQPEAVDKDTLQKVEQVIKELNFSKAPKSSVPREKKKVSSGTIAVMIPEIYNPHFQQFLTSVGAYLAKKNYLMTLCVHENNSELVDKHCKDLIQKKVSGCIIGCLSKVNDSPWVRKLCEAMPVCAAQSSIPDVDLVDTRDELGAYELLELLIRQGHRKIAFVAEGGTQSLFQCRLDAYLQIQKDYQIPYRPEYVVRTEPNIQASYEQTCRLLSLEDRPTAIFCYCLAAAMGVYIAIRDMKLRIPEDISVVSMDDADIARLFTPPITVESQPVDAMAVAAADLVLDRVEHGNVGKPRKIIFPTTLVNRESVAPCLEKP